MIRVALSTDQVRDYRLPVNPGKVTDSRAAGFIERHGSLMQVELDALDPDDLRALYQAADRPLLGHVRIRAGARGRGGRPGRLRDAADREAGGQ